MPKTLSINVGVDHRNLSRPASAKNWIQQFDPTPPNSLTALRIKSGPFIAETDGFHFINQFVMTAENATQIRDRFGAVGNIVIGEITKQFIDAMNGVNISVGFTSVSLPQTVIDYVIGQISGPLVVDQIIGSAPGTMGRCGGMAFAGYDFYLANWQIDSTITVPPSTGDLGDYIFNRLLDSLDLNASTYLEWFITLHILPIISKTANIALATAIGSLAGPIGAALGAFIGSQENFFNFGGPKVILDRTINQWQNIKSTLDQQAACPIGILYGDSVTPLDDHQILAIGYSDSGDGNPSLNVWNNNEGNSSKNLTLHFNGDELEVDNFGSDHPVKGILLDNYSPSLPPKSLKR
ncbi:MAG: hypothetical protein ACR2FN_09310 [Chitinophagaceae bacterium]